MMEYITLVIIIITIISWIYVAYKHYYKALRKTFKRKRKNKRIADDAVLLAFKDIKKDYGIEVVEELQKEIFHNYHLNNKK